MSNAPYKSIADEYDALVRHMNAGGDFFEFQTKLARAFEPFVRALSVPLAEPPKPQCEGEPGECEFNRACMYHCGAEPPIARDAEPSGYAYRYPDGIRFNNGREVNGCKPIEVLPYWFRAALASGAAPSIPTVSQYHEKLVEALAEIIRLRLRLGDDPFHPVAASVTPPGKDSDGHSVES